MKDVIDKTVDRLEMERKLKENGGVVKPRKATLEDFYADAERRYEEYLKDYEEYGGADPYDVAKYYCGRHS